MTIEQFNECGREMERMLRLESYPLAIKWYEKAEDLPADAIRPLRDLGKHAAFCQAKAMARMRGMTIAMTKEDHWCWNPLIAFGMVDCSPGTRYFDVIKQYIGAPAGMEDQLLAEFPRFELGKYEALVVAPLFKAAFEPDIILIYSNTMQLNTMIRAIKQTSGRYVKSEFDCFDSCTHATVTPIQTGEYKITVPDPGDVERARAGKDEMILSVPIPKLESFMEGLRILEKFGMDYRSAPYCMPLDFERPPFYNEVFGLWGLDQGTDW